MERSDFYGLISSACRSIAGEDFDRLDVVLLDETINDLYDRVGPNPQLGTFEGFAKGIVKILREKLEREARERERISPRQYHIDC